MRYVIRDGVLIEKHLAPPKYAADAAPYVISDVMDPLKHMATGRLHDSKAAFRADTRAAGCEEVGTDPAASRPGKIPEAPVSEYVDDVKRAIAELNR